MTSKLIKPFVLIFFIACVASCSKKDHGITNVENNSQIPLNPNGDSELALLMRDMYDEAERIKTQLKHGEELTINLNHEAILTAHATEPEKAASAEYKAFAKSYLQSLESLQKANASQVESQFENMVANCMACHQALCPGPMVRIKKLR